MGLYLAANGDSGVMTAVSRNSCFVGSVDVVNNKWLLHTLLRLLWIEEADPTGNLVNSYYRPGVIATV